MARWHASEADAVRLSFRGTAVADRRAAQGDHAEWLDPDPCAGDDVLWADEDLIRPRDEEDLVAFFRSLIVSLVLCMAVWAALAAAAIPLHRLVSGS